MITALNEVSEAQQEILTSGGTFTLQSNDIGGQMTLKQAFNSCFGENKSPALSWSNPPEETKSFAITMHDSDAPTGSGWWHWLVVDIPADTHTLPTNAGDPAQNLLPAGSIQIKNDYGMVGYGGPCPPEGHGFHQYCITVFALKIPKLNLDTNASAAAVGFNINANTIEKATIVAYYKR